jgi:hypothetical protein
MSLLLQELQALEVELHHRGARCNRKRLEELLHPEFYEVGRSGRTYDREAIVNSLSSEDPQTVLTSGEFSVSVFGPEVALLTYRSAQLEPSGHLARHTLRSSLWLKVGTAWQLRYHQGTAAAQPW